MCSLLPGFASEKVKYAFAKEKKAEWERLSAFNLITPFTLEIDFFNSSPEGYTCIKKGAKLMLILTQKRDHLHEILCSWTYNCDKILYTNLILNNRPALLSVCIFSLFLWKEWNSISKFRCIAIPSTDSIDIHTAPQLVSLLKTPRQALVYATYKKLSFKKKGSRYYSIQIRNWTSFKGTLDPTAIDE